MSNSPIVVEVPGGYFLKYPHCENPAITVEYTIVFDPKKTAILGSRRTLDLVDRENRDVLLDAATTIDEITRSEITVTTGGGEKKTFPLCDPLEKFLDSVVFVSASPGDYVSLMMGDKSHRLDDILKGLLTGIPNELAKHGISVTNVQDVLSDFVPAGELKNTIKPDPDNDDDKVIYYVYYVMVRGSFTVEQVKDILLNSKVFADCYYINFTQTVPQSYAKMAKMFEKPEKTPTTTATQRPAVGKPASTSSAGTSSGASKPAAPKTNFFGLKKPTA